MTNLTRKYFLKTVLALTSAIVSSGALSARADGPAFGYDVTGVLKSIAPGTPTEILVKHEPIPDYRDENGRKVGMRAMTMPFYVDDTVLLSGVAPGDRIHFQVSVWQQPAFKERVTSLTKAAETQK